MVGYVETHGNPAAPRTFCAILTEPGTIPCCLDSVPKLASPPGRVAWEALKR